jgi:hypothetical protein
MPSNPLRKRSRAKRAAKAARNLAIADAVYAFVRDRIAARVPGVKPKRRVLTNPKALAAAGAAAGAAVAVVVVSRAKHSQATAEPPPYAPAPTPAPAPTAVPTAGQTGDGAA